jgi:hypothetical protein
MRPVLKRILVNGALTAGILVVIGLVLAELARSWIVSSSGRAGAAGLNPQLPDSIYYRVPLTLAIGGFLFVAAGELIMHPLRRKKQVAAEAKPTGSPSDDVEKLLNELLAQAEARQAAEARSQETGRPGYPQSGSQEAGGPGHPRSGSQETGGGNPGRLAEGTSPPAGVQKAENTEQKTGEGEQDTGHGMGVPHDGAKPPAEKPNPPPT